MKYFLQIKALGRYPTHEVSENEFVALREARATLSNALSNEEAYDILVSNHLEFERELLNIAAEEMMRFDYGHDALYAIKATVARRLANLLTAGRIYVDQAPRQFSLSLHSAAAQTDVETLLRDKYDSQFAYRFMAAYRHHIQHFAVTVDSMTLGGERDQQTKHLSYVVEPNATKEKLGLNPKFKRTVLNEMPDKVDLRQMARGYVAALSDVHHQLRKRSATVVTAAQTRVGEAIQAYRALSGEKPVGLYAIHRNESTEIESFPLMLEWDETRQWLAKRNKRLVDLERHFVTSEIKPGKTSS